MARWKPGWTLIAAVAVAVLGLWAWVFAGGLHEDALRSAIRTTARLAGSLFAVTFAASAVHALVRRGWTATILRSRRFLGLSVSAAMLGHLSFIAALAASSSSFAPSPITVAGGGLGYLFLVAMTATSSDGAMRALGARRWAVLHRTGMYWLWVVYFTSWLGRTDPASLALTAALVGALLLRIGARVRSLAARRAPVARPAQE